MTEKLKFERAPAEGAPTLGVVFHVLLEKDIKETVPRAEVLGYVVDDESEDEEVNGLEKKVESAEKQIERLANFIMGEVPGEPSQSEGPVDCAIRIIETHKKFREGIFSLADFLVKNFGLKNIEELTEGPAQCAIRIIRRFLEDERKVSGTAHYTTAELRQLLQDLTNDEPSTSGNGH